MSEFINLVVLQLIFLKNKWLWLLSEKDLFLINKFYKKKTDLKNKIN